MSSSFFKAGNFDIIVTDIVNKHVSKPSEYTIKRRLSQEGNYIAITVTIQAKSRKQLDNIYLDLTEHKKVLMAL